MNQMATELHTSRASSLLTLLSLRLSRVLLLNASLALLLCSDLRHKAQRLGCEDKGRAAASQVQL